MEVTCLFINWDVRGDVGHELLGVYDSLTKAQNALRKQTEIEKTQSWIKDHLHDVALNIQETDTSFFAELDWDCRTELWVETHTVE